MRPSRAAREGLCPLSKGTGEGSGAVDVSSFPATGRPRLCGTVPAIGGGSGAGAGGAAGVASAAAGVGCTAGAGAGGAIASPDETE